MKLDVHSGSSLCIFLFGENIYQAIFTLFFQIFWFLVASNFPIKCIFNKELKNYPTYSTRVYILVQTSESSRQFLIKRLMQSFKKFSTIHMVFVNEKNSYPLKREQVPLTLENQESSGGCRPVGTKRGRAIISPS